MFFRRDFLGAFLPLFSGVPTSSTVEGTPDVPDNKYEAFKCGAETVLINRSMISFIKKKRNSSNLSIKMVDGEMLEIETVDQERFTKWIGVSKTQLKTLKGD
jgi:hypothetical protein